jgi:hypothetical protein
MADTYLSILVLVPVTIAGLYYILYQCLQKIRAEHESIFGDSDPREVS